MTRHEAKVALFRYQGVVKTAGYPLNTVCESVAAVTEGWMSRF
jgi:hypothetical protein